MNTGPARQVLLGALLLATLAGCNTVTHSPIVFTSRQTIGVDVRPTASDTRTPGVAIGIRSSDFAWVPAIGIGACAKWRDTSIKTLTQADRDGVSADWEAKCESKAYAPKPLLAHSNHFNDIFSVYGQFDAKVGGFLAGSAGDAAPIAKVFAAGLAAQLYTSVASANARNECLEAIDKLMQDKIEKITNADVKGGQRAIARLLKQRCAAINLEVTR